MDQRAVGEFLKRLRVRAKYTQTDLGARIGVTDKAISRWESGIGMPEIGNLMELAKLYGVTVDDILNLNEAVFAASDSACNERKIPQAENNISAASEPAKSSENDGAVYASEPEQTVAEPKKRNVLSEPSRKFRIILLFAYFALGAFVAVQLPAFGDIIYAVFFALLPFTVTAIAIVGLVSEHMPRKAYFITNVVLWAVNAVIMLNLSAITSRNGTEEMGAVCTIACTVLALLFIIQILYEISDFVKSEKARRGLIFAALGASAAIVIVSIGACSAYGAEIIYDYGYINSAMLIASLSAFAFATAQAFTKWVNIVSAVLVVPCAILSFISVFHDGTRLFDLVIENYETFNVNVCFCMIYAAIETILISWFFEGHRPYVIVCRVAAVIAVIAVIPTVVLNIDAIATNAIFRAAGLTAAAFIRLTVLVAVVLTGVKLFRFDLLARSARKERRTV